MMTTTHAFAGALLGAAAALVTPVAPEQAIAAGFLGGALPDADLLWTHRRSLHFPVYGSTLAVPVALAAIVVGAPVVVLAAVFVVAAAVHAVMDAFGGGVEHRPWEATSERGVYNHATGQWVSPRRWVRYAGAPEDLLLAAVCAVPLLAHTSGTLQLSFGTVLACSGLFVGVRRRIVPLAERLFPGDP